MIFAKNLKEKRLLFIILMILEEFIAVKIANYDIRFQLIYVFLTFLSLKVLYKEKAQITDVFTFMIGSIILLILNGISYGIIFLTIKQFTVAAILSRVLMFLFLVLFRNKLCKIQNLYKKFWNRNDNVKKKIKSTTFRCINLLVFNVMFYVSNIIYKQAGV